MNLRILSAAVLGAFVASAWPSVARAQDPPPVATVATDTTTSQATGPSMGMVWGGVGIFALSFVPVVVAGSSSGLGADRSLLVPLAGPWIDLMQRPGCSPSASCNGETTDKVLLIVDGVFQAIGALTVVGGFLATSHETRTVRTADLRPTLRFAPAQIGGGAYGMLALGRF